ncbi:MAG: hypothetical protein EBT90_11315 [Rhodobacteraceae bacterium]|nr:hypothetical protein [Paracoccaceae bacterium]
MQAAIAWPAPSTGEVLMKIDRTIVTAKHNSALATIRENCLKCHDCKGTCWQIFEMWSVPETIVNRGAE